MRTTLKLCLCPVLILIFFLILISAPAATVTPTWYFNNYTDRPTTVTRVDITPLGKTFDYNGTNYVTTPIRLTVVSHPGITNGSATTNLVSGAAYDIAISDTYKVTHVTNVFDAGVTGAVNGADYEVSHLDWLNGFAWHWSWYHQTNGTRLMTNVVAAAIPTAFWSGTSNTWITNIAAQVQAINGVPSSSPTNYVATSTTNLLSATTNSSGGVTVVTLNVTTGAVQSAAAALTNGLVDTIGRSSDRGTNLTLYATGSNAPSLRLNTNSLLVLPTPRDFAGANTNMADYDYNGFFVGTNLSGGVGAMIAVPNNFSLADGLGNSIGFWPEHSPGSGRGLIIIESTRGDIELKPSYDKNLAFGSTGGWRHSVVYNKRDDTIGWSIPFWFECENTNGAGGVVYGGLVGYTDGNGLVDLRFYNRKLVREAALGAGFSDTGNYMGGMKTNHWEFLGSGGVRVQGTVTATNGFDGPLGTSNLVGTLSHAALPPTVVTNSDTRTILPQSAITSLTADLAAKAGTNQLQWFTNAANTNDIYYINGGVGIGTNTPYERLHVNGYVRSEQGFIGRGTYLTDINPDYIDPGTAAIDISGNAATADSSLFSDATAALTGSDSGFNIIDAVGDSSNEVTRFRSDISNTDLGYVYHTNGLFHWLGDVRVDGTVTASNIVATVGNNGAAFKSASTNVAVGVAPNGGSWILTVGNDGVWRSVTNSGGL